MSPLAEVYLDWAGWIFLAVFALLSVLLAAVASSRLPERWWIGAGISALAVTAVALLIAFALQGLDTGEREGLAGIAAQGWLAIGVAGLLGFVAGADVQMVVALPRRDAPGFNAVIAGAIGGPIVIIGGYLLLVRTMDWARFGFG